MSGGAENVSCCVFSLIKKYFMLNLIERTQNTCPNFEICDQAVEAEQTKTIWPSTYF